VGTSPAQSECWEVLTQVNNAFDNEDNLESAPIGCEEKVVLIALAPYAAGRTTRQTQMFNIIGLR
jgi:hypothetical protein